MAQPNGYFWGVQSKSRESKLILGSFAPAGTGAPTDVKGDGFSVARTDVGIYTITLDSLWNDLISANATMQHESVADLVPQFGDYVAASGTIVLSILAAATATEVAADANSRVHFQLAMKRTTTTPQHTASVG